MAETIGIPWHETGATVYAIIRNSDGEAADVATDNNFETYATANLGDYDLACTEQGTASKYYAASFPTWISAGVYAIVFYQQTGGSPAETDPVLGTANVQWNGSAFVVDGDVETDVTAIRDKLAYE
jgi:hypothetical protein